MYKALNIASIILSYCDKKDIGLSNLKLQKILYFVQCEFIKQKHEICFYDDIEAWPYGPVVPNVYRIYSKYMAGVILLWPECTDITNKVDLNMIYKVVDKYVDKDAWELVNITHSQEPWICAKLRGNKSIITVKSLFDFCKVSLNEK